MGLLGGILGVQTMAHVCYKGPLQGAYGLHTDLK